MEILFLDPPAPEMILNHSDNDRLEKIMREMRNVMCDSFITSLQGFFHGRLDIDSMEINNFFAVCFWIVIRDPWTGRALISFEANLVWNT